MNKKIKSLKSFPKLKGDRVVVRVDYNVPMSGEKIKDTRRIDASFETINTILKKGGIPVLIAHMGDSSKSLRPIAKYLGKKYKVVFVGNDIQKENIVTILENVKPKHVILLENIRRYDGEEKNDAKLAKTLASFGKYYVNDAFSVSHRAHASVVGIPKHLTSFAGIQLMKETEILDKALMNKSHPFLFILGGAKFGTKIPLIKRFIKSADNVIIAGAILNNFYKVSDFEVGKSVVEEGYDTEIKSLMSNTKLLLPVDVIVQRGNKSIAVLPFETQKGDMIVDIGPQSTKLILEKIKKARMVVWNGPTGFYERGFVKGTTDLAKGIVENKKAMAIIGGGDTSAVIEKIAKKIKNNKIFVSTGGGATLDYLANAALPGIDALK
jgi:phosphoglycerate kinase